MSRGARSLVGLLVGLTTLILTGIGSTAFAAVGPPDGPASTAAPLPLPPSAAVVVTTGDTGTSVAQQIAWMATGAVVVLVLGALVVGIAVLSRRHHVHSRQLQMP